MSFLTDPDLVWGRPRRLSLFPGVGGLAVQVGKKLAFGRDQIYSRDCMKRHSSIESGSMDVAFPMSLWTGTIRIMF